MDTKVYVEQLEESQEASSDGSNSEGAQEADTRNQRTDTTGHSAKEEDAMTSAERTLGGGAGHEVRGQGGLFDRQNEGWVEPDRLKEEFKDSGLRKLKEVDLEQLANLQERMDKRHMEVVKAVEMVKTEEAKRINEQKKGRGAYRERAEGEDMCCGGERMCEIVGRVSRATSKRKGW